MMTNRQFARRSSVLRLAAVGLAMLAGISCSADHLVSIGTGVDNHRVTTGVGGQVEVSLWGGGMGEYASPPTISGPAVTFLYVTDEGPINPGGPTQRFRFRAVVRGTAIVTFTPQSIGPAVVDTIVVE